MTKPSDFTPDRVFELEQPPRADTSALQKHVWISRAIGLALLTASLAVLGATGEFGSTAFLVNGAALIGFGTYVLLAETRTRHMALALEKRLRLGLLVHNMELENMAMQDDLTQLFNRRYFFERMERELETARAFKRPLAVVVLDLDSMKAVNDTYGHRTGDELLSSFGRFLLDATRASDIPARIGGDEFAIILPDTTEKAAHVLKNRLVRRLDSVDLIDREGLTLKALASFGLAGYPEAGDSVDEIMQRADADMYAEKGERKGTAVRSHAVAAPPLRLEKADA